MKYDVIAIGGGSGGLAAAQRAALHGARAAVIEYGPLGGTCVNVGCVPKKVMWYAADIAHALHDAAGYGMTVQKPDLDWGHLKTGRDEYVQRLNNIYLNNLRSKSVDYFAGTGRFVDAHTVEVNGEQLQAGHIIVATGGHPMRPDIPGGELGITSDGFFELVSQPCRIAVVGSGYIAVELGGMFNALGTDVHHFIRKDAVLRNFDPMLSNILMDSMIEQGMQLSTRAI
ncbi:MAG: FAD-dependent oxidoreductase, partial [Gammaproteobacteria bacterium]|nr:FAD-dependent oxidoreductase [Gammaproteobacteria bacterium]